VREGMFITMAYAVVDAGRNRVTVARAGHEPALLSRREAATGAFLSEFVRAEGMPVGLVEPELFDAAIEDRTLDFTAGATLVLYTDGVTEAPNREGREFGGARLADALRAGHAGSAAAINDAILRAVGEFTGTAELRDDYTLLTVKRVPG